MGKEAIRGIEQRGLLGGLFKVVMEEIRVSGRESEVFGGNLTSDLLRVRHETSPKALLHFNTLEGSFTDLIVEFNAADLPVVRLSPAGGVRYDSKPWDTGTLPERQYTALRVALLEELTGLLERHNMKPSAKAKKFFDDVR